MLLRWTGSSISVSCHLDPRLGPDTLVVGVLERYVEARGLLMSSSVNCSEEVPSGVDSWSTHEKEIRRIVVPPMYDNVRCSPLTLCFWTGSNMSIIRHSIFKVGSLSWRSRVWEVEIWFSGVHSFGWYYKVQNSTVLSYNSKLGRSLFFYNNILFLSSGYFIRLFKNVVKSRVDRHDLITDKDP